MIPQASAIPALLIGSLGTNGRKAKFAGLAAFVSLSSWTSPRGFAGVWANVPGTRES
jgi:hypothetical protein